MLGLATALLLLLPEVVMPRPTELSAAAAAGDTVELERLATRLGPNRLLALVEDSVGRKQIRLAVAGLRGLGLLGAQHPDLGAQLLPPFTDVLTRLGRGRMDDRLLGAATEALHRTAASVGRYGRCSENDVLDCSPLLTEAAARLLGMGADATLPLPLREGALDSLAALPPPAWQRLVPRIVQLAQGPGPTPQRAAMVVLSTLVARDEPEPLLTMVRTAEPELASLAAGELCATALPGPTKQKGPHPVPIFADDIALRIRSLAAPEQLLPTRQRVVECLRLLGTAQDKALAAGIVTAGKKGHK